MHVALLLSKMQHNFLLHCKVNAAQLLTCIHVTEFCTRLIFAVNFFAKAKRNAMN